MKGPSGRILYRVERRWKCDRCGKERATGGEVVTLPCPACPPGDNGAIVWMSIVEPRRLRNPFPLSKERIDG